MYVPGGTFNEVCAYLAGYAHGSNDCALSGEGWRVFNRVINLRFRFPDKYGWPYVLRVCSNSDEEALSRLQSVLTEFVEKTQSKSYEEIVAEEAARMSSQKEGEPERAWRRFSRALHRGTREQIELLIQEHPAPQILWSGSYPDDVIPLLDQIQESYVISQIAGSEAEGSVTIITPDFGPIPVARIDGLWKIDATKVIDRWEANRKRTDEQQEIAKSRACSICGGSGKCYCIRKGDGDPANCPRCNGTGQCRWCKGRRKEGL